MLLVLLLLLLLLNQVLLLLRCMVARCVGLLLLLWQITILKSSKLMLRLVHVCLLDELIEGGTPIGGCLWHIWRIAQVVMHVVRVFKKKHVEILFQILVSLSLAEVIDLLVEVTRLLYLCLGLTKSSPPAIESLKERVAEEGCRILREVHV